ncbi:MAG: hypothetical protein M3141_01435 [Actinomycetota bacterium]|nr:hypothetical protein [Actinomycetota bacterium]
MRRAGVTLLVVVLGAAGIYLVATAVVAADHDGAGSHSENMRLIANYDDGGKYRNGTDIAFWGDTAVLGRLDQGALGAGPGASG